MDPKNQKSTPLASKLLEQDGLQFQQILAKVQQLQQLNQSLKTQLDPELAKHCSVANYQGGKMTVFLDDAAWATKFRYLTPSLLSNLRQLPDFRGLGSIVMKVQPIIEAIQPPEKPLPPLSKSASDAIRETASTIQDGKLRKALERLAKNVE